MKKIIGIALICFVAMASCKNNAGPDKCNSMLDKATAEELINFNPCTRAELEEEIAIKLKRVGGFLAEHDLDGILLTTTRNFSWITAGIGDNHIEITSSRHPHKLEPHDKSTGTQEIERKGEHLVWLNTHSTNVEGGLQKSFQITSEEKCRFHSSHP